MTVGETLLKITDYPFSFSIIFLILRADGIKDIYSEQTAIFLLIAGFIGTALTILDPIGKMTKYYFLWIAKISYLDPEKLSSFEKEVVKNSTILGEKLMKIIRKIRKNDYDVAPEDSTKISWTYIHSAFHTSAIELEKDKIVSTYYFIMTVFIAMFVISYSGIFTDNYPDSFKNNVVCNVDCAKSATLVLLNVIAFFVIIVLIINGNKFFNKILIVATYLFSVGSKEVPHESTESIYQFVEIGDWQTAEYWRRHIQEDLKYKRGMRDLIIKSSESVYEPLYKELIRIESTPLRQTELAKEYFSLGFEEWDKIKGNLQHLSITDGEFVKLADSFQKETIRYDNLINRARVIASEIILKHLTSIYGETVINVSYGVKGSTFTSDIQIQDLAQHSIFGSQPNTAYPSAIPEKLTLTLKAPTSNPNPKIITGSELNKFLNEWDSIVHDVKDQNLVKQLDESYLKILKDIETLKEKCEIQNKLKYEVF